jgi:O-methyltransferase domain/Dimerisation domain
MNDRTTAKPADLLRQIAISMRSSRALHAAAELKIADHLSAGPMSSADLAAATRCHVSSIYRLMRALSALGVFAEAQPGRFRLTEIGDRLRSDAPGSFRSAVLFLAGDVRWRVWSDLIGSIRDGRPAINRVLGVDLFDFYEQHPAESEIHDQAMAGFTTAISGIVLDAYDFARFHTVVDVGGGSGRFIADVLAAHPHLQGILFDLSHVVGGAPALLEASDVAGRCRCESGSFFDAIPAGADGYMLKQVIHDWDDARVAAILAACRRAMPPDATLLILERVMPERVAEGQAVEAFLVDLEMLVMTPGGRERTEREFEALLSAAGFSLASVTRTASPISVIEARPA